jgi:hypothetical protein
MNYVIKIWKTIFKTGTYKCPFTPFIKSCPKDQTGNQTAAIYYTHPKLMNQETES